MVGMREVRAGRWLKSSQSDTRPQMTRRPRVSGSHLLTAAPHAFNLNDQSADPAVFLMQ